MLQFKPYFKNYITSLLTSLVALALVGCSDKKGTHVEKAFSFEDAKEDEQVMHYARIMAKWSVDALSQLPRLYNLAQDPEGQLSNYSKSCISYEINEVNRDKKEIILDWRNLNCTLAIRQKKYFLSGREIVNLSYENGHLTQIELRSRNLQLHRNNQDLTLDIAAVILIDPTRKKIAFTQNTYIFMDDRGKNFKKEWDFSQEGSGVILDDTNHKLVLSQVKFDGSFEKFKINSAQRRFQLDQHKITGKIATNKEGQFINDVMFDFCSQATGHFAYEMNYNNLRKVQQEVLALDKNFVFPEKNLSHKRSLCGVKAPFFYTLLAIHSDRFHDVPTTAVAGSD